MAAPGDGALEPGWARALLSIEACQRGRCAFVDPGRPPNRSIGASGCDGYHASRRVELDGVTVTVRWYLCANHRAWWKHEQRRRAAAAAGKGA